MEESQYTNYRLSSCMWTQAGCQEASRGKRKHPHIFFFYREVDSASQYHFQPLSFQTQSEQLILSSITLKGSAGENHRPPAPFSGVFCFFVKPWLKVSLWMPRPPPQLRVVLTTVTDCNVAVKQHNTWYGLCAAFLKRRPGDRTWAAVIKRKWNKSPRCEPL